MMKGLLDTLFAIAHDVDLNFELSDLQDQLNDPISPPQYRFKLYYPLLRRLLDKIIQ